MSPLIRDAGPDEHPRLRGDSADRLLALGGFLEDAYDFEADVLQLMNDPHIREPDLDYHHSPEPTFIAYELEL